MLTKKESKNVSYKRSYNESHNRTYKEMNLAKDEGNSKKVTKNPTGEFAK